MNTKPDRFRISGRAHRLGLSDFFFFGLFPLIGLAFAGNTLSQETVRILDCWPLVSVFASIIVGVILRHRFREFWFDGQTQTMTVVRRAFWKRIHEEFPFSTFEAVSVNDNPDNGPGYRYNILLESDEIDILIRRDSSLKRTKQNAAIIADFLDIKLVERVFESFRKPLKTTVPLLGRLAQTPSPPEWPQMPNNCRIQYTETPTGVVFSLPRKPVNALLVLFNITSFLFSMVVFFETIRRIPMIIPITLVVAIVLAVVVVFWRTRPREVVVKHDMLTLRRSIGRMRFNSDIPFAHVLSLNVIAPRRQSKKQRKATVTIPQLRIRTTVADYSVDSPMTEPEMQWLVDAIKYLIASTSPEVAVQSGVDGSTVGH